MDGLGKSALLVVDVQNDYCSGGSFEIPNFLNIIPIINRLKSHFNIVIYTKNLHHKGNCIFKENGGNFPYYCMQDTEGAKLHLGLVVDDNNDYIIHKNKNPNYYSYSAFYNSKIDDNKTNLDIILQDNSIKNIYVCGLLAEYCVYSTLLDAIKFRYKTYLIEDATLGFNKEKARKCYKYLIELGMETLSSSDIDLGIQL